ncbi:MAG: DNA polymerase III subunit beta [Clostridia bacterium]|nr:DNA polymerase III subunit beta [Clostridia bacterium]
MKFICEGIIISDAAITVSKACSAKTTNPVLECIKISAKNDELTLTAYDGEISIEQKIKAEVLEEGEVCVNGKFFSDFVGKISDNEVVISENEKGIKIGYGDNETFMQVLPAEQFPKVGGERGEEYFELKESEFKNLIAKTAFCCATDESRPILKGCLLEAKEGKLYATALDGFRMAVSECETAGGSGDMKIVCPARTLVEISRMMEGGDDLIRLYVNKNMMSLQIKETLLNSRLYVGEFVRKENIYPVEFTTEVTLLKDELIRSIERASIVIRGDKNNLVLFDIKASGLMITANSEMGNFAESVSAVLSGKELKIAMNGKYILDALKVLDEDKVKLSFNTSISPFTVENETDKTSSYLVLPVRTSAQQNGD